MADRAGYLVIALGITVLAAVYLRDPDAVSVELVVGSIVALVGLVGVMIQLAHGRRQDAERAMQESRMKTFEQRSETYERILRPFTQMMGKPGSVPEISADWMVATKRDLMLYASGRTLKAWGAWLAAGEKAALTADDATKKLRQAASMIFLARFIKSIREDFGADDRGIDEIAILKQFVIAKEVDGNVSLLESKKFRDVSDIP